LLSTFPSGTLETNPGWFQEIKCGNRRLVSELHPEGAGLLRESVLLEVLEPCPATHVTQPIANGFGLGYSRNPLSIFV
jgi:hypothetical protein